MKLKNKFALIIALTAFQFINFGEAVEAAEIDTELAIIAAEQDSGSGDYLTPAQNPAPLENISGDDKKKSSATFHTDVTTESQAEENSAPTSEVSAEENISEPTEEIISIVEEEVNQSDAEKISQQPEEKISQQPEEKISQQPEEKISQQPEENISQQPEEKISQQPEEKISQPASLSNPVTSYANFEELAKALNFTPLYIPKKSGYAVSELFSIANQIAEIKYGRRWEPEVSLTIRTYKRPEGEGLKDISGVQGVKWRIDMTSGAAVYIAKIDERSHVAAWSSGRYTFSAHVENISFAAFHSLVIDELVDLTTHYYAN